MINDTTNPLDFQDAEIISQDEVALDNLNKTKEHIQKLEREKKNKSFGLSDEAINVIKAINKLTVLQDEIDVLAFLYVYETHFTEALEKAKLVASDKIRTGEWKYE